MGNFEKGSVESTHKVPTSHYHTKHCHAAVNFYMKNIHCNFVFIKAEM